MSINRRLSKLEGRVIAMLPWGRIHDLETLSSDQLAALATGDPHAKAEDFSEADLIKLAGESPVLIGEHAHKNVPLRFKQLLKRSPDDPKPAVFKAAQSGKSGSES